MKKMINSSLNITFNLKNVEELEKVLILINENKINIIESKIDLINNKNLENKCEKCHSKMRFVKSRNWKFKDFSTCDICNPRFVNNDESNNQNNKSGLPNYINCPQCSNIINQKKSKFGIYFKCNCWFKIDWNEKTLYNYI